MKVASSQNSTLLWPLLSMQLEERSSSQLLYGSLKIHTALKGWISHLPPMYFSQKKSWMSGDILHKILHKIDVELKT